ncbi:hypothetical protein TIFTF001_022391 [Ficus carica]|uniref:Uncharacterized protein n=1 Tax=Ficus carica TaxID=3494 RepID=A0AA88DBN3_FICCA|nr:hypothetical protein TIFTF001_022391 [Ficus carica]
METFRTHQSVLAMEKIVPKDKESSRSNGDTDGVSVTNTPMLKSKVVLVSKQRGRVLARKNCPYLNKWANPLFIDILHGLGCSGDPVGLNSECPRQVDMLQAANTLPVWPGGVGRCRALGQKQGQAQCTDSKGPRALALYSSGSRSIARSGVAGPRGAVHRRWWSFNPVPGEGFCNNPNFDDSRFPLNEENLSLDHVWNRISKVKVDQKVKGLIKNSQRGGGKKNGGRISWVARSGGDGRTLRGLNLIGQIFGTPIGGEAGCGEPRGKLDPSLQTYGKVKEWPVVVETKGEEKFWIKPTKSLSGIKRCMNDIKLPLWAVEDTNIPQQGLDSYLYPSSSRRKPAAVPGRGAALLVLAERKLTSYVYAAVYVCMASKLPLVEPIHISSGLVYNLIMMAFKEGLKVRYSSKYLSEPPEHSKADLVGLLMDVSWPTWVIACCLEVPDISCRGSAHQPRLALSIFNMSDQYTDSENDNLSGEVDITSTSSTDSSDTTDQTGDKVEQGTRTPDYLLDIFDIPTSSSLVVPTSQAREGAAGEDTTSARMARQASTSGRDETSREGFESLESTTPLGEPVQSRQCGRSRLVRINGLLVFRISYMEMVDRVGGRPMYTVNYLTTAVTPQNLESLREDFRSPVTLRWSCRTGASETERCPHATQRELFLCGAAVQSVPKPVLDEDSPFIDRVLLLPSLSSTSDYPHDRSSPGRPEEVTVAAPIPDSVVHYRAWTVVRAYIASTSIVGSKVPQGVPTASIFGLQSGSSSPGTWGPRIADKDVEKVIRRLYPSQGLRIEGFEPGSFQPSRSLGSSPVRRAAVARQTSCPSQVGRLEVPRNLQPQSPEPSLLGRSPRHRSMDKKAVSLVAEVKRWRDAVKVASKKAKKAEERSSKADEARKKAKEQATRAEEARKKAKTRLLAEYKEGMRDMKTSFTLANPMLIGLDWSFMPEISGETVAEGEEAVVREGEKGEVVKSTRSADDVVVIEQPEPPTDQPTSDQGDLDEQIFQHPTPFLLRGPGTSGVFGGLLIEVFEMVSVPWVPENYPVLVNESIHAWLNDFCDPERFLDHTSLFPVLRQSGYGEVVDDRVHPSPNLLGAEYLFVAFDAGLVESFNWERDEIICIDPRG